MSSLTQLLGHTLVKNNEKVETAEHLSNKDYIGLYFGAIWCGYSRQFMPTLEEFYNSHATTKNFELVYVSGDRTAQEFEEFTKTMPWVAIPYPNKTIRHVLMEKYGVRGFPTLLIIDKEGNVQTYRGRELVTRDTRAKFFPWSGI